ncbi:MAG: hypothetical protein ACLTMP_12855 [Eggerthella lenta]
MDMALFGIARRLLRIVRHAGARKALIRLAVEDGRARLVVEDDGVGCGLSASRPSGALPQAVDGEGTALPAWPSACTCWAARFRQAIEPAAASAWLPACR